MKEQHRGYILRDSPRASESFSGIKYRPAKCRAGNNEENLTFEECLRQLPGISCRSLFSIYMRWWKIDLQTFI